MGDATVTDEALMHAVREGDVAKLALLFERYHRPLFEFLSRMTGNPAVAEDLVQDVFVRILKYRATFRDDGRFDTWIYRIARNARADYFKRRGTPDAELTEAADRPSGEAPAPDILERDHNLAYLERALLMLPEDKRELIVLARYRGLKHAAIAEILGVDVGTVKVRTHRAVNQLRETFLRLLENPSWNAELSDHSLPSV